MRSVRVLVGSAVIGASVLFAVPAQAATAPAVSAGCSRALAMEQKAEAAYQAALASYKQQVAAGGHPGTAEQQNLSMLENAANLATSDAARDCPVTPSGAVHTGVGGATRGVDSADVAGGVALLALGGIGTALALGRRRPAARV
ncbi:hypothetical protein [Phaeacidiphilus oryzae]|uniref:hypothetical protein n=1 Tax=Phaeacidiphilus oryzae TaxID=348818 RepID=UPI000560AC95|nr:hypothetical protein [Phaeacidiphilus oryzae]